MHNYPLSLYIMNEHKFDTNVFNSVNHGNRKLDCDRGVDI